MEELIKKLYESKNVALFGHINADPDALGSVVAMSYVLKQLGKQCDIFLNEKPQSKFEFLGLENVKYEIGGQYDLFVALDISDTKRLGKYEDWFKQQTNTICIDHHIMRAKVGLVEYVDAVSTSTCEILLDMFEKMDIHFDDKLATMLYLGLSGDTGGLMYSNTTVKTHENAMKLMKLNADTDKVNTLLFLTKSLFEVQMIGKVISRIEIYQNFAISYITQKDRAGNKENFGSSSLVNFVKCVENVDIGVLIKQNEGRQFTISLRSNEKYDVAAFAARFGGGGHMRASGISLVGSLAQVKKLLIDELTKFVSENG